MPLDPCIAVEENFGFIARFTSGQMDATYERLTEALQTRKSVSLDFPALNVFFRLGMFLNGRTAFREIRRVTPEPIFVPPTALSRDEVIDAYIDLFRDSIRRRTPPHSALALSGGCDSRHILLEMHSQHHLPDYAFTIFTDGAEVAIASELAGRTGLKHVIHRLRPSTCIQDEVYKNQACDFTTLEHGWMASAGRERDALPWWDGIAGDVLSAGLFLEEWSVQLFEENRLDELADRLVSSDPVPYFRDQALFPRADAVSQVRAELSKHRLAPNPVGSFYFWNRTRIPIAASAFGLMAPKGRVTLAPFLDRELWTLLASLPARMLLDHNLHSDTLMRAYPSFSDIPFFDKNVHISSGIRRRRSLRLLAYLATTRAPDLPQILMMIRAFRALVIPRHCTDIDWLLPLSVYCTELRKLASAA